MSEYIPKYPSKEEDDSNKTSSELLAETLKPIYVPQDLMLAWESHLASYSRDTTVLLDQVKDSELTLNTQYQALLARVQKYEQMLQDITMDSNEFTMDTDEVNFTGWNILAQASYWDYLLRKEITKLSDQIKSTEYKGGLVTEVTDAVLVGLIADNTYISNVIGALSDTPLIRELDAALTSTVTSITDLQADSVRLAEKQAADAAALANQQVLNVGQLVADIEASKAEQLNRLAEEAAIRTQLLQELEAKTDAITADYNAVVDTLHTTVIQELTTMQDGISASVSELKTADEAIITSLDVYKVSNGQNIAALQNSVNVVTNAQESTASQVTGLVASFNTLDSGLSKAQADIIASNQVRADEDEALSQQITTINSELGSTNSRIDTVSESVSTLDSATATKFTALDAELVDVNTSVASARQIADSAVSTNIAQASEINTLNSRMSTTEGNVTKKADASALSTLETKVDNADAALSTRIDALVANLTTPDGTEINANAFNALRAEVISNSDNITTHTSQITALNSSLSNVNTGLSANADAVADLRTTVTQQGGSITSHSQAIQQLQSDLDVAEAGLATKASSTALTTVDNKVTAVNGRIDTTNSNVTSLTGRVSTVEGAVSTKADASALNSLTTRVATEEGKSTSQGSAITALQNTINHATTGLSTKASSAALTAVDNKVTAVDGKVTTNASNITTLQGKVTTVENGLTTKADVSAVNALTTRVGNVEGGLSTQASDMTALKSSLGLYVLPTDKDISQQNKWARITLRKTQPYISSIVVPDYSYIGTYPEHSQGYFEEGATTTLPIDNSINYYRTLINVAAASTINLGNLMGDDAHAIYVDGKEVYSKAGYSTNACSFAVTAGDHVVDIVVNNGEGGAGFSSTITMSSQVSSMYAPKLTGVLIGNKAEASAIQTTNTEVSRINGVVAGHSTQLINLTASIAGKADTTALNSLTTRVSDNEGEITSQSTKLTKLDASIGNTFAHIIATFRNGVYRSGGIDAGVYTPKLVRAGGFSRGMNLVVWASDGTLGSIQIFDTYGTPTAIAALATAVLALPTNTYFTLVGMDNVGSSSAFQSNADLKNFVVANGGSSDYYSTWGDTSLPIFTSMVGTGSATGIQHSFNSNVRDDWVKYPITFIGGIPEGMSGTQPVDASKFASASALSTLDAKVEKVDGKVSTQASQILTLTSDNDANKNALQVQAKVVDGVKANYMVKMETNGVIGGFGLMQSTGELGQVVTTFGVNADVFFIGAPAGGKKPFMVTTANQVVDGITYPAGTYINTALIANATIGTAKIADAAITNAKILDATIESAKIKSIKADKIEIGNPLVGPITPSMVTGTSLTNAANLFNGNAAANAPYATYGTGTQSATSGAETNYIQVDVGSTVSMPEVIFFFRGSTGRKTYIKLKASVDGNNWDYIIGSTSKWETIDDMPPSPGYDYSIVTNQASFSWYGVKPYRYLRIYGNGSSTSATNELVAIIGNASGTVTKIGSEGILTGSITADKMQVDSLSAISADLGTIKVDTAHIEDAAVTNAKIADLAVDTLKIQGNSVTVPTVAYTVAAIQVSSAWTTIQSITAQSSLGLTLFNFNWLYASTRSDTRYIVNYRILKNGVVVVASSRIFFFEVNFSNNSATASPSGTLSLNYSDSSLIDGTYELQLQLSAGSNMNFLNRYASALVVRR